MKTVTICVQKCVQKQVQVSACATKAAVELPPRFPPVFSRGDNCPHCATYWLPRIYAHTQLTLKIASQWFFFAAAAASK